MAEDQVRAAECGCDDGTDSAEQVFGDATPSPELLRRVVLGVAYDGAPFHGFAAQPGQRTVAGELGEALGRVFGVVPRLVCAGRTDAGVHARAQVVHADLPREAIAHRYGGDLDAGALPGLTRSLSHQLAPSISVFRAEIAPTGFDARRSAIWRRYRYDLDCSGRTEPALAGVVWSIEEHLDLAAMRIGADPLIGEHDFAAFCRRVPGEDGPIHRRVIEARFVELGAEQLRFEISAVAFCHQMVRSIVGMLVAIGLGRARPPDVVAMLRSGSRQGAPTTAPARGLCLTGVGYPDELGGSWQ